MIHENQKVQYWLAELDRYDNARLVDGAHSSAEGAIKAKGLYNMCGFSKGRKFAVAKVELTEITEEQAMEAVKGVDPLPAEISNRIKPMAP